MMKFITIKTQMIEAIYEFCMEQMEGCEYTDTEVKALIDTAFGELVKIKSSGLPVSEIKRYDLFVSGGYSSEILPPFEDASGVICREMVHLASFTLDEYGSTDCPYKRIERGYDVIYDVRSGEVKLLYKVDISDNDVTSVYRVETDLYENFCTADFIIKLSIQLAGKLRNAAEYVRKECDAPCV